MDPDQDAAGSGTATRNAAMLLGADPDAHYGDVDWAAIVEKASSSPSAATDDDASRGFRTCPTTTGWSLPPALLIFMIPCIALIPFYVSIYAMSRNAVDNVLTAQVILAFLYMKRVSTLSCRLLQSFYSLAAQRAIYVRGAFISCRFFFFFTSHL